MKNIIIIMAIALLIVANFSTSNTTAKMKQQDTKVNVWDTYVTKKDKGIMHFDIIAPVDIKDTTIIHNYGKEYLKTKGQEGQSLTSKQCRFCHIENLRPAWEKNIAEKGYFIIEMEGCN